MAREKSMFRLFVSTKAIQHSREPESNQRPMDDFGLTATVQPSTD